MSSKKADWKPYQNGKTIREPFIDKGIWFMLLRDAQEYSEGSGFKEILTDYINQLEETNVFPSSFDFELNLEDFKTKFIEITAKDYYSEDYFKMMSFAKSSMKIKDENEFKSFFSCRICFKVLDACKRMANKCCQVCNFNCCEDCFEQLAANKKCPICCLEKAFIDLPIFTYSSFQNLFFKCTQCKKTLKTLDF